MIRKCLKGLCIALLTLLPISFSNASCQEFDIWVSNEISVNTNMWYELFLENWANFKLNSRWRVIQFQWAWNYPRLRTLFRNNDTNLGKGMYVVSSCAWWYACQNINTSIQNQWFFQKVAIWDLDYLDQNCNNLSWLWYWDANAWIFYNNSNYTNPDKLYIIWDGIMQRMSVCFWYSPINRYACFSLDDAYWTNLTWSMGFTYNPYVEELWWNDDQISPFFSISPFWYVESNVPSWTWWGVDWSVISTLTTWWLIKYFEESPYYKFNVNMCYIWTRDIVSVYENRIPYYEWTWYTIFDFYSKLYNVSNFKISQVWSFVNTRYINFATWFGWENRSAISWDPLYNAYYSHWSWFRLDQWSWLTNPFLWNLSAYFFLWSVYDVLPWLANTPWEELATYCYKKLYTVKWTPSNIVWTWSSWTWWIPESPYTIVDDHNKSYDQNANMFNTTRERHHNLVSWNVILDAKSWNWTPLDYFGSDGLNNMNFNDFFSNAFNKFKYSFWTMTPDAFWVWALPWYIILFLLAIIFFRFLSH